MSRSLHPASSFVLSAGTVTLDLARSRILLIHNRTTDETMLPKGRKDVGETLEQCAIRETWEETGFRASLLPLRIDTQATWPRGSQDGNQEAALVTEPVCVTQREKDGVLKIIFWYAAQGDSEASEAVRERGEGEEGFESLWVYSWDVREALTFEDDREVARLVIDAFRRSFRSPPSRRRTPAIC